MSGMPVVATEAGLLALLREDPASRVVEEGHDATWVRDTTARPWRAVARVEDGSPAAELLQRAYDADVRGEDPAALPLRYGPWCSTFSLASPDQPPRNGDL